MIELHLTRGDNQEGVRLRFPTTPAEIGEAFALLDTVSRYAGDVRILDVKSPVANIGQYVRYADLNSREDMQKLNTLAERIGGMSKRQRDIFAGALDAESVNGLDDVLRVSESLEEYTIIPNVSSDTDLGKYVAAAGLLHGDPRFPEKAWPYLDFAKIGAEYYADRGGAYTYSGYVLRKQSAEPEQKEDSVIRLQLETTGTVCVLHLPAEETELDAAKAQLGITDFAEARIEAVEFLVPYLEEHIPVDCVSVESANELAMAVREMGQTDGELLKYLAVLSAEQPEDFPAALDLALELDDYERVPDDQEEYGKQVLRRFGVDEDVLDILELYTDFERLGEAYMEEDDVQQTEFGFVRRISTPFPNQTQSQQSMSSIIEGQNCPCRK